MGISVSHRHAVDKIRHETQDRYVPLRHWSPSLSTDTMGSVIRFLIVIERGLSDGCIDLCVCMHMCIQPMNNKVALMHAQYYQS